MVKNMALECKNSIQETNMRVSFKTTPSTVKVFTPGEVELDMRETL